MNTLSIIIPTLSNTKGLKKLLLYLNRFPYQIIFVDNQPNDDKKQWIKKLKNDHLVYLPQPKNQGFAKAINLGVKEAIGEWLLILNDDINFEIQNSKFKIQNPKGTPSGLKIKNFKDPFLELIRFARKNNLIAVSPILINPKGKIENLGYQVLPYGKIKLINEFNFENLKFGNWKLFGNWNLEIGNCPLDGLTAACLLIKKSFFEEVGGFDERFFAYLEDVDLFLTLKEKGYRFFIHPQMVVIHHHLTTGKTLGWIKNWLDFKNWILLIIKHPKKFKWNHQLFIERLKNLWGIIKTVFIQRQALK